MPTTRQHPMGDVSRGIKQLTEGSGLCLIRPDTVKIDTLLAKLCNRHHLSPCDHRAAAAFFAISDRFFGLRLAARASPPFTAPSFDSAAAAALTAGSMTFFSAFSTTVRITRTAACASSSTGFFRLFFLLARVGM